MTAGSAEAVIASDVSPPIGLARRLVHRLAAPTPANWIIYLALAAGFMLCFLQTDILYNSFVANQLARGHLNVYAWFSSRSGLTHIDTVMPPLYYLTTALYLKILALVHLDPTAWNRNNLFTSVFHTRMGIVLMLGVFLLKLPNLAMVIIGAWAVARVAKNAGVDTRLATFLWFASPALIVSVLMQAQNDVFAAVISLFALLAFQSRRVALMFLILGLAACFKTYPLVLVPPTALLLCNRNLVRAVGYSILAVVPLAVVSIPFLGHAYISRVFEAHDGNTLLSASFNGRLPVHFWVLAYLAVLALAWIRSRSEADVFDVVLMWFLPLAMVFVCNWWVPQWTVWLLPAVVLIGTRDRIFAWTWVATNLAIFVDNVLNYPGNMDGAMLEPFYGDRNHPANSHFYNYHLFHIWEHLPYAALDGVYIVCGALFLCLAFRAGQWLLSRSTIALSDRSVPALPDVYVAALAGTGLLVPYILTMVIQRLTG